MEETMTPFTFFQFFSFIIWYNNTYIGYANVIIFMTVCSICISVYEIRKQNKRIRKLSYYDKPVHIYRRNETDLKFELKEISCVDLQIGDLVFISPGEKIPADIILLNGKCVIDESLITGESTPCLKQEASDISPIGSNNILIAGTTCLVSEKGATEIKFSDYKVNRLKENETQENTQSKAEELRRLTRDFITDISENLSLMDSKSLSKEEMIVLQNHELKNKTKEENIKLLSIGVVVNTGFYTIKGKLIRDLLFQPSCEFKFKKDSLKFIFLIFIIVLIGFIFNVFYQVFISAYEATVIDIIIRSLDLFTTAIPPTLPLSLVIGVEFASDRLRRKKIFSMMAEKINQAGRVKLFCFDKTGTLTKNTLILNSIVVSHPGQELKNCQFSDCNQIIKRRKFNERSYQPQEKYYKQREKDNYQHLIEAMGLCHSLSYFKSELIGDPLDLLMFEQSGFQLVDRDGISFMFPSEKFSEKMRLDHKFRFKILKKLEFTSERKRMSVLVTPEVEKQPISKKKNLVFPKMKKRKKSLDIIISSTNEIDKHPSKIRRKGSNLFLNKKKRRNSLFSDEEDEVIEKNIALYTKGAPEIIKTLCTRESIPADFDSSLEDFARQGFRVLGVGIKIISQNDLETLDSIDKIEENLHFVGFMLFENPLKSKTRDSILNLRNSGIGTVMITGDNLLTAMSVSVSCQIADECSDIRSIEWDDANKEVLINLIQKSKIKGQKTERIKHFEEFDETLIANKNLEWKLNKKKKTRQEPKHSLISSYDANDEENLNSMLLDKPNEFLDSMNCRFPDQRKKIENVINEFPHSIYAMSGNTFDSLCQNKLMSTNLVLKTKVFGRSNPEQKARIVGKYQKILSKSGSNDFVGFCGDGANDCLALRRAHIGLSLTQTEASIAAPFSTTVTDISSVLTLLKEGKCCLQIAIENFEFVTFTALTQYFGQLLLYVFVTEYSNGHYYYMDLLFTFVFIFLISRTKPNSEMTNQYPPGDLLNFPVMIRLFTALSLVLLFLIIYSATLTKQPFYLPAVISLDTVGFQSTGYFIFIPAFIFYMVIFSYFASVFIFSKGGLFKIKMIRNYLLLFGITINIIFITPLLYYNQISISPTKSAGFFNHIGYFFLKIVNEFFRTKTMSVEYANFICLSGVSLFLVMLVFDKYLISFLIEKYVKRKNELLHKKRLKLMKLKT
jgi:cation-transporting ATPase 13A3/4/5